MAEKLLGLTGIVVSMAQAERLKALYNALEPYNKRAIEVHMRSQQPNLRGTLLQSKEFWAYNKRANEEVIVVDA